MAIAQPVSTDKQNSPSHSLLHRIIAADTAASVMSLVVDSNDNIVMKAAKKLFLDGVSGVGGNTYLWEESADVIVAIAGAVEGLRLGTAEVVVNEQGANLDFRVEGDTISNLFHVDASADFIGIGITPLLKLHVLNSTTVEAVPPAPNSASIARFQKNLNSAEACNIELIGGSAANVGISFGDKDAILQGRIVYENANDLLNFYVTGTSRLKIDSSGNLIMNADTNLYLDGGTDTFVKYDTSQDVMQFYIANILALDLGPSEVVFNENGVDLDFRIEGNTDTSLFKADAGTDRLGFGQGTPLVKFHFKDGAAGVGTPNTSTIMLLEDSGATRFEFLTPGAEVVGFLFSDAADGVGKLLYDHTNNSMQFVTASAEAMRIDSSGRLLIFDTTSRNQRLATTDWAPDLQSNGTIAGGISHTQWSAGSDFSKLWLSRSKSGTVGTHSLVADTDILGQLIFGGSDGTNFVNAAGIKAVVQGTPGSADMPGSLVFSTTPDGSATMTDRFRIEADGTLASLNSTYETLVTADDDIPNRKFVVDFVGKSIGTEVSLTDAATIATDASLGSIFYVTLADNRTLGTPTNPTAGQKAMWRIKQDATGGRTITLSSAFRVSEDIGTVTLSTAANAIDYMGAVYNGVDAKWDVIAFSKNVV